MFEDCIHVERLLVCACVVQIYIQIYIKDSYVEFVGHIDDVMNGSDKWVFCVRQSELSSYIQHRLSHIQVNTFWLIHSIIN